MESVSRSTSSWPRRCWIRPRPSSRPTRREVFDVVRGRAAMRWALRHCGHATYLYQEELEEMSPERLVDRLYERWEKETPGEQ
jgi:hypothetical protein